MKPCPRDIYSVQYLRDPSKRQTKPFQAHIPQCIDQGELPSSLAIPSQLTGVCGDSEDRCLQQQVRSWSSGSHSFRSAQCQVMHVPVPRPSETVCPACSYSRGGGATSHHPCLQPRLPGNGSWGQQMVSEPQNRQDLGVKGHKSKSCFHCSPSLSLWRNYPLSEKQFLHLQVRIKPFSVSADSIGGRLHRDGHKKL